MRVLSLFMCVAAASASSFAVLNVTDLGDTMCDPTQHSPAQLCPGGWPCPDCGTKSCTCEPKCDPTQKNP